jgi:N-acetylmuramoyl-L-alanine amidase
MMKKRLLTATLTVALALTSFCRVNAASTVDIHYNDWGMPVTGYLKDGTTYVPIRQFFNLLGGSWVTWDEADRSATVKGNASASFYLNSQTAWYNGTKQTLTGRSYAIDGTMYVPLRGLAGVLDCDISYSEALRRVTLSTNESPEPDIDSVYWLSRIIEAESGAEPYKGKLAVGNVILNRVKSPDFPNSIYGVIFDRVGGTQFSPVAMGTIYRAPSVSSVIAAKICLEGYSISDEILFFMNPRIATSNWISKNRPFAFRIGNHDFYK